jgi:hypothetical protein
MRGGEAVSEAIPRNCAAITSAGQDAPARMEYILHNLMKNPG